MAESKPESTPEATPDTPEGTVVAVHGDRVTVRVDPGIDCPRCAAGGGCGAAVLAAGNAGRCLELDLPPGCRLDAGDRVRLSLAPAHLLHAAWLAYGVPLGMMLAVALAGARLLPAAGDGMLTLAAVLGLLLGGWWARRQLRRRGCLQRFVPVLGAPVPAPGTGGRMRSNH